MAGSSNFAISLGHTVKEASSHKLLHLLTSIDGRKDLVLDSELICSLDYVANFTQLKSCGVEKVFKLEPGSSPGSNKICVYLVRSRIKNIKIIADHVNANKHASDIRKYYIIFVPRRLYACDMILEREGVYGNITTLEYPLGFLPLDEDLFSLELTTFYKEFFLKQDLTHVHTIATSLVQLCAMCGCTPKIFGQGRCSQMVIDLMHTILNEIDLEGTGCARISRLIILDRDIDYASVLLSQLTYEGLLDETFGIISGRITFPKEVTGADKQMKFPLNSSDAVYKEIRNSYFPSIFTLLREKAKHLQSKSETSNMTLGDIKHFVSNEMKNVQQQRTSLSLHIGASEKIIEQKTSQDFQEQLQFEHDIIRCQKLRECMNFIEDKISKQDPFLQSLRLLCLLSITQDGFSSKDYESMVTTFLQSYGYEHLVTTQNLKKLGLLVEQQSILPVPISSGTAKATKLAEKVVTAVAFPRYSAFSAIAKKFNLIPTEENVNLNKPTDMSYTFGGAYVPLIGRITEQVILNDGSKIMDDGMKMLPGSTLCYAKPNEPGSSKSKSDCKAKNVVLCILGGITYAEIASLRLISQVTGCNLLIAPTSMISGNGLIKMLIPEEE